MKEQGIWEKGVLTVLCYLICFSGFKEQIYDVYRYLPPATQVVLISATLPHEILEMTNKFMTDPIRILVKRWVSFLGKNRSSLSWSSPGQFTVLTYLNVQNLSRVPSHHCSFSRCLQTSSCPVFQQRPTRLSDFILVQFCLLLLSLTAPQPLILPMYSSLFWKSLFHTCPIPVLLQRIFVGLLH